MQLRDYQTELIAQAKANLSKNKVMLQLPTGGGKTVVFTSLALDLYNEFGTKTLILAHRVELVVQAYNKLIEVGVPRELIGFVHPKEPYNPQKPFNVGTIQTYIRRQPIENLGLLIIDEAHHTPANSYREVMLKHENAGVLGVTATPIRLNGEGFEDMFDLMLPGPSVSQMIKDGYLFKYKAIK